MTKMISDKLPESKRCREFIGFRSGRGRSADQSLATRGTLDGLTLTAQQEWTLTDCEKWKESNFGRLAKTGPWPEPRQNADYMTVASVGPMPLKSK